MTQEETISQDGLEKFVSPDNLKKFATKVKEQIITKIAAIPEVPVATSAKAGLVKPGTGLGVTSDGTLNVNFKAANDYTDNKLTELVGGAPEALDTLKEISDFLDKPESEGVAGGLVQQIAKKANAADVYDKATADATFVKDADLVEMTDAEVDALCAQYLS